MPKYKSLIAEFGHAYRQYTVAADALDRSWILIHPNPDNVDHGFHSGLILKLYRREWSIGVNGEARINFGLALRRGNFEVGEFGDLPSALIRKVAEIKAQVELWQEGFRDELPSQNEVDEL